MTTELVFEEPQWILDYNEAGAFWRRDTDHPANNRVKFRHKVEIKEFNRNDAELENRNLSNYYRESNALAILCAFLLCLTVTVIMPWYMLLRPH